VFQRCVSTCVSEEHTATFSYTHQYILFKKSKIYIETFILLLHVLIIRSSSESIYCSLLKLSFKTFSELLRYINFGAVAACCVLCVSRTLFRMSLVSITRATNRIA